jgi:hypothetical protein
MIEWARFPVEPGSPLHTCGKLRLSGEGARQQWLRNKLTGEQIIFGEPLRDLTLTLLLLFTAHTNFCYYYLLPSYHHPVLSPHTPNRHNFQPEDRPPPNPFFPVLILSRLILKYNININHRCHFASVFNISIFDKCCLWIP